MSGIIKKERLKLLKETEWNVITGLKFHWRQYGEMPEHEKKMLNDWLEADLIALQEIGDEKAKNVEAFLRFVNK